MYNRKKLKKYQLGSSAPTMEELMLLRQQNSLNPWVQANPNSEQTMSGIYNTANPSYYTPPNYAPKVSTIENHTGKYTLPLEFNMFNAGLTGANLLLDQFNDAKIKKQERQKYQQMIQPRAFTNYNEAGLDNIAIYAQKGGELSAEKAKKILKDGKVYGKPLTKKQKRYFGMVASGRKMQEGGQSDEPELQHNPQEEMKEQQPNGKYKIGQELDLTVDAIKSLQLQGYQFDLID